LGALARRPKAATAAEVRALAGKIAAIESRYTGEQRSPRRVLPAFPGPE